jgi:hypothetical protein
LHTELRGADVQVIADQVQEGLVANELARAINGVAVPGRAFLRNKTYRVRKVAGSLRVSGLITWPHDDADLSNIRRKGLFDEDTENGFLNPVVD